MELLDMDVESMEMDYPDDGDLHMYVLDDYWLWSMNFETNYSQQYRDELELEAGSDLTMSTIIPPQVTNKKVSCKHNDVCCICLERIDYTNNTNDVTYCEHQCGQSIHTKCIQQWTQDTCPYCRVDHRPIGKILPMQKKMFCINTTTTNS